MARRVSTCQYEIIANDEEAIEMESPRYVGDDVQSPLVSPGASGTNRASPGASGTNSASPGASGTNSASPGASGTNSASPGASRTNSASPGPSGTNRASPGASGTNSASPGASGTNSASPGASRTNSASSGASGTNSASPGASRTNSASPGVSRTNSASSGASGTNRASPGASGTNSASPGASGTNRASRNGCRSPEDEVFSLTGNHNIAEASRQRLVGACAESARNLATPEIDADGWTPLTTAVHKGWTERVRALLDAEADITVRSPEPTLPTVLHLALHYKHYGVLALLLAHKDASTIVNVKNFDGETPIFEAIASKNVAYVTSLLKAGSDVTIMSKRGTVLHKATMANQPEIVKALFAHGKSGMDTIKDATWLKPPSMPGSTALHLAAHAGLTDIVGTLLTEGCNIRAKMEFYKTQDFTALHLAVYMNAIGVVDKLLKSDPSVVDEESIEGWTPIHIASAFGYEECARLLLFAETDLSARIRRDEWMSPTNMDVLLSRLPFSVDFLRKTFDLSILYQTADTNDEGLTRRIDVNYSVLSPHRTNSFQHMNVIDSLLQTGEHLNQHRLFLHPLIESYLHLQWKSMSPFYYRLLLSYIIFTIGLSCHVIGVYYLQGTSWLIIISRFFVAVSILFVIYYEGTHTLLAFYKVVGDCHCDEIVTLSKRLAVVVISCLKLIWVCCLLLYMCLVPEVMLWPHELATSSLLMFWFRLMYIISNIPHYGYYLMVFFEVASNFFKVLFAFSGIIGVFAASFLLELGNREPFNSTSKGIVRTFVMMSSEFDYSDLSIDSHGDESFHSVLFRKFLLVMFILLVSIVIMNILIANAITRVKKIDRIRKQAEFLIRFEKVIDHSRVFCSWLSKKCKVCTRVCASGCGGECCCGVASVPGSARQYVVTISVGEDWKSGSKFPRDLRLGLLEIANQNMRDEMSRGTTR